LKSSLDGVSSKTGKASSDSKTETDTQTSDIKSVCVTLDHDITDAILFFIDLCQTTQLDRGLRFQFPAILILIQM
jgi:hypothetical protein